MKRSLALLSLSALMLTACGGTTAGNTFKIGYIGPLTGDAASYGADTLSAVQMKVAEINAAGGINGKQIELIAEDGRCNGADATSAAQKLVNVDKVIAILGGQCSSETLAAGVVVEPAKVTLISGVSTSPDVTNAGPYVYRTIPSDAFKGKAIAAYFAEKGYKKVAIVSENTDFCQGIRSKVKDNLADDAELVFDEVVDQGVKDYRTLFTRLQKLDADVLVVNGQSDATVSEMAKQARELKIDALFMGSDTSDSATLGTLAGEAVEGMLFINTSSKLGEGDENSFAARFRKQYGEPKSNMSYATLSYDAAGLLAEAIGKAPEGGEALKAAMDKASYTGAAGTLAFDENGDVLNLGYALKTFTDGKIVELESIEAK